MKIQVRSYAYFRKHTAHLEGGQMEVPEGTTTDDILNLLNVPPQTPRIVLVNGRACQESRTLQPGDLLVFYPLLEGG